jgi:hypothetical protein
MDSDRHRDLTAQLARIDQEIAEAETLIAASADYFERQRIKMTLEQLKLDRQVIEGMLQKKE